MAAEPLTLAARVAILVPLLLVSGCIEYHIEAPHQSVVLARGAGRAQAQRYRYESSAPIEQHQFSLVGIPTIYEIYFLAPAGFFFLDRDKFSKAMMSPLVDAAIVTKRSTFDFWVGALTFGVLKSHTVGIYTNVRC